MSDVTTVDTGRKREDGSMITALLSRINTAVALQAQFDANELDNTEALRTEKEKLTAEAADMLKQSSGLAGREKLNFLTKLAPLVYWGYDVSAQSEGRDDDEDDWLDDVDDDESSTTFHKPQGTSQNYKALQEYLETIADFDFTPEQLHLFLKKDQWRNYDFPNLIAKRAVSAVSRLPTGEAKQFIPEVRDEDIPTVISKWPIEDARPYVDRMMNQAQQPNGEESKSSYTHILNAIENWPPEQQAPVVMQMIDKWEDQDVNAQNLFQLLHAWPAEQSFPIVKKAIEICKKKTDSAATEYTAIAAAMGNWSPEQVLPIFEMIEASSETDEDEGKMSSLSGQINRNRMELAMIAVRTVPLDATMIDKLKSSQSREKESVMMQVIENHPELFSEFSPYLVSSTDNTIVTFTVDKIFQSTLETQYGNMDTILKCYSLSSIRRAMIDLDSRMEEVINNWDEDQRNQLIRTLLLNEHTTHNGLLLLDKVDSITDPNFISVALKYALAPSVDYFDLDRIAKNIAHKIVKTPETEKIIAASVLDSIILGATQQLQPVNMAESLINIFEMGTIQDYLPKISPYARSLIQSFNLNSLEDIIAFAKTHTDYVAKLAETPDRPGALTQADIPGVFTSHLSLYEADLVKEQGIEIATANTEEDFKNIFEKLSQTHEEWRDNSMTSFCFKQAAEKFGYKRMFTYIDRREVEEDTHTIKLNLALSRHDALHAYFDIEKIFAVSGLTADQFYGNILNQVRMDDSPYEVGSAQRHFNSIVQTMNPNIEEVLEKASKYQHVAHLQELIETVKTPKQIFSSWNGLKRYSDLEQELQQTEMLDVLVELRAQGKDRLCDYVEKLAFHPTSKVNMVAVKEFLNEPERHLAAEATHLRSEIHALKKPSNYVDIHFLDMNASQLRDALVEGDMDAIKAFKPMEITYQIPVFDGQVYTSIVDLAKVALGSADENIAPRAANHKKLYGELEVLFSGDYTLKDFLAGKPPVQEDSINIQKLREVICNPASGLKKVDWQEYVATLHNASSADAVLAGTDTAGCDGFGDGKNANYTFNLNCGRFTIQLRQKSGKLRTFAQSTLTKDKDVKRLIPQVIHEMREEKKHLIDVISPQVLQQEQAYIAADNIEVAKNFRTPDNVSIIEALYADFFGEYARRFAEDQQMHEDTLLVGEETYEGGFVKQSLGYLPKLPNTFAPQAPVTYTDKHGERVRTIDIQRGPVHLPREVRVLDPLKPARERPPLPDIPGIQYLSYEDTLPTAYLEGKVFSDNDSLIANLHGIENIAIASEINNAAKNRSPMSIKHTNQQGIMDGYMFAYEGRMNVVEQDFISPADRITGEPVLYIADMAADHHGSMAGARTGKALTDAFVQLYRQNYLDKGNFVPIAAHAREQTSYRLIKKQLERMSAELHMEFQLEEFPPTPRGKDLMYPVIIRPVPAQNAAIS